MCESWDITNSSNNDSKIQNKLVVRNDQSSTKINGIDIRTEIQNFLQCLLERNQRNELCFGELIWCVLPGCITKIAQYRKQLSFCGQLIPGPVNEIVITFGDIDVTCYIPCQSKFCVIKQGDIFEFLALFFRAKLNIIVHGLKGLFGSTEAIYHTDKPVFEFATELAGSNFKSVYGFKHVDNKFQDDLINGIMSDELAALIINQCCDDCTEQLTTRRIVLFTDTTATFVDVDLCTISLGDKNITIMRVYGQWFRSNFVCFHKKGEQITPKNFMVVK